DISLSRTVTSGADGSITVPALPVVGAYSVTVTKAGFQPETTQNIVLRAGETATVRARLTVSGGTNEVTVYATAEGVRADPQTGRRLDSRTIDETPIPGRKGTTMQPFDYGFRPANNTGQP